MEIEIEMEIEIGILLGAAAMKGNVSEKEERKSCSNLKSFFASEIRLGFCFDFAL